MGPQPWGIFLLTLNTDDFLNDTADDKDSQDDGDAQDDGEGQDDGDGQGEGEQVREGEGNLDSDEGEGEGEGNGGVDDLVDRRVDAILRGTQGLEEDRAQYQLRDFAKMLTRGGFSGKVEEQEQECIRRMIFGYEFVSSKRIVSFQPFLCSNY